MKPSRRGFKKGSWWWDYIIVAELPLRLGIGNDNALTLKQVAAAVKLERLYKSLGL